MVLISNYHLKVKVLLSSHYTEVTCSFSPLQHSVESETNVSNSFLNDSGWNFSNLRTSESSRSRSTWSCSYWQSSLLYPSTTSCALSPLHPGCSRSRPAGWLCTAWFSLSSKETWTGDWWMTCGTPGPPLAAPGDNTDTFVCDTTSTLLLWLLQLAPRDFGCPWVAIRDHRGEQQKCDETQKQNMIGKQQSI